MTDAGDKVVTFARRFGHRLAAKARDLANFPRLARALGLAPPAAPEKPPVSLLQDLGDNKPRN